MSSSTIALIGNPNCGKTTLFNRLTGSRQHVGNWPGITVEKKVGYYNYQGNRIEVVDLPGTYALESIESGISQDELVVRNYVLEENDSLIVNIIDATNLQRNLYLTTQLLDLKRPMIIVLNMIDVLHNEGESIDIDRLSEELGCPIVAISANRNIGIDKLHAVIEESLRTMPVPTPQMHSLSDKQAEIIHEFLHQVSPEHPVHHYNHWQIFELLLGADDESSFTEQEREALAHCRQKLEKFCGGEIDIVLANSRYDVIDTLARLVLKRPRLANKKLTARLDQWALGRITGIPIFLGAMYLMFMLSINFGSAFIDFFDIFMSTIFVDGTRELLTSLSAPDWFITIMANGLGSGLQTVSTFIPVIAAMFLCLSFLEDSGYLARAAMIVDRAMCAIGLPGKAFVPMLVGFGCNVPAIMGTRTLESSRDRLMSIMMIPYMSCGARLPVYALFAAVFFPVNAQNVVFMLYLVGIGVAVITGFALKHSILPGQTTPFIMELPSYRMPTLRNLLSLTWEKLKSFIVRAGKAIVMMVMVLSILNSLGTDGTFGNEDTDKSVLANIGKTITPAFTPMGVTEENWPATVGIFTGIFAKESVIGTLNSLYSQMGDGSNAADDNKEYDLLGGIGEAFATIPENIKGIAENITDPFGISAQIADGDLSTVQEENEIDSNTVTQIQALFGTSSAAVAYLLFILLYTPCAAALGAVYREAGAKWTFMVAGWTFMTAWVVATGYYQFSLLGTDATHASSWLIGLGIFLVVLFLIMRMMGRGISKEITLPTPKENTSVSKGSCCH